MARLQDYNKDQLLNLLAERLAFERSGVKLYDKILEKMKQSGDKTFTRMLGEMKEHRDEEKEHEEWLEQCIRDLGGDAHAETELSRLVTKESEGLERVVMSDPELPHLFHALYAAELVDNAGWDLLIELADEADDDKLRRAFKKRLHEEEEHLILMRKAVERLASAKVFGEKPQMPTNP